MVKLGSYVTWKMARFYESGREETDSVSSFGETWREVFPVYDSENLSLK